MMTWIAAWAAVVAVWGWWPGPGLGRVRERPGWMGGLLARVGRLGPRLGASLRGLGRGRVAAGAAARVAAEASAVCDLLAVCLEAGRPPRSALRVVVEAATGPTADVLASVLAQIELGVAESAAWASLATNPGYEAMARDVARSVGSGAALADLLRRHAADARREALATAQVRARAAGVTGVLPLVLCFLPAFVLVGVVPLFGAVVTQWLG